MLIYQMVFSDKYSDICSVNLHATNSVTSPLTFSHGSHGIFIYSIPTIPTVPVPFIPTHMYPYTLLLLSSTDPVNSDGETTKFSNSCCYTVKYSDIFHATQVSTIIFKSLKYIVDCCHEAGSKYGIGFMAIHHFSGIPNVMSTICIYIYMCVCVC